MAHPRRPAESFSRLMTQGYALLKQGKIDQALARFDAARETASGMDDGERVNKAVASISACYIELGEYETAGKGLREIILRSTDDETICAASYNLSISLRRQGQHQKAFTYAQRAFEKSRALNDLNWMARCH